MLRGLIPLLNMTGIPRLVIRLMRDRRVPLASKLVVPAALLYVISPIDIFPDMLPVRGQIDDVLVLIVSLIVFLGMAPKDVVWEHFRGAKKDPSAQGPGAKPKGTVIDGKARIVEDGEGEQVDP